MRFRRDLLVCAIALAMPLTCAGFEADVHFGLTLWLARQAGFAPRDAEAIALADQRIDAGSIEYMTSPLQYACLSRLSPMRSMRRPDTIRARPAYRSMRRQEP